MMEDESEGQWHVSHAGGAAWWANKGNIALGGFYHQDVAAMVVNNLNALEATIANLTADRDEAVRWREAVLDAHVVNCSGITVEQAKDPEYALTSLILMEIDMENDPAISKSAANREAELATLRTRLAAAEGKAGLADAYRQTSWSLDPPAFEWFKSRYDALTEGPQ